MTMRLFRPNRISPELSGSLAGRMRAVALCLLVLSVALLAAAVFAPIGRTVDASVAAERALPMLPVMREEGDLRALLARTAGRHLIRPAQVQPAVKDSGDAQRLLKRLKLQGVVEIGSDMTAYIQLDKKEVKSVARGEKVLGFDVESIEPGKVTLSLEGVRVYLVH